MRDSQWLEMSISAASAPENGRWQLRLPHVLQSHEAGSAARSRPMTIGPRDEAISR